MPTLALHSLQARPLARKAQAIPPFSARRSALAARSARSRRAGLCVASSKGPEPEVVIVGAGVAGLNCAAQLQKAGVPFLLLEASDGVGGRVRTDEVEGFLLDRGFQIFLTSYPESKAALDYAALDLKPFYAGALVRFQGDFHRVADPFRHLVDGLASLPNPIGSPVDKVKVGLYRLKALLGSVDDVLKEPETSILQALRAEGFSEAIIDRFFRPFLGGIFFDRGLGTTSRLLKFVMRMLATGENCLPSAGIGAVADQLAAALPARSVRLGSKVAGVAPGGGSVRPSVTLEGGDAIQAKAVVVAVEGPEASRLLGSSLNAAPSKAAPGVGTACLYFAAPRAPRPGGVLYLDGEGGRLINNMCFPSEVSSSYAPAGQTLVSVSTIGTREDLSDADLEAGVRREAGEWFGAGEVASWHHLRTYRIPFAQPGQAPPTDLFRPVTLGGGLYVCGDHRCSATLDGALKSGRLAAEAVLGGLQQAGGAAAPVTAGSNAAGR